MKDQNSFKEKLYNYTLPVKDDVWGRIEANLPAQKRRFPLLWITLGSTLLVGALVIALTLNHDGLNETPSPEKSNIQDLKINTNTNNNIQNPIASAASENNSTEINTSEITTKENTSASSIKTHTRTSSHKTPVFSAEENLNVVDTKAVVGNDNINQNAGARNFIDVTELTTDEIKLIDQENEMPDMSHIKPDPSCYKFSGKHNQKSISADFFAGPGFAPRTFEDNTGEGYAQAREATESSQYAWSAGARVNLNLRRGLALRLGVMYEQIGDIFDYTDTAATQQHMVIDSFFAADGTFLYTETSTETILGTLIKKIHNRYSRFDLPILASYEMPMGRTTLMFNGGPVINLTSTQKGQILDPNLNPRHITPGEPDEIQAYKSNLGFSIYLGAGILFPLTDNISALIEPRFLYRINPVTLDTYSLKERRSYAGLNLGIRYHFN